MRFKAIAFTAAVLFTLGTTGRTLASGGNDLVASYFSVHAALADDDLSKAGQAFTDLATLAQSATITDHHDAVAQVLRASEQGMQASNLEESRQAFHALSKAVITLAKEGHTSGTSYIMFCPMAFGNSGGAWLQSDKNVKNPYFGKPMLGCGVTQETLAH